MNVCGLVFTVCGRCVCMFACICMRVCACASVCTCIVLQSSLGGNAMSMLIATISPAVSEYETTMSTLQIAVRTKGVKNDVRRNEVGGCRPVVCLFSKSVYQMY